MTRTERANQLAQALGFKNAYERRIESALLRGASRSQARGHARAKKGELSAKQLRELQRKRGLPVGKATNFFETKPAPKTARRPTLKQLDKLTGFERRFTELVRFVTDGKRKLWAAFDFGTVSKGIKTAVKEQWRLALAEGFAMREGGPVEAALILMNVLGVPAKDYGKLIEYTLMAESELLEGE